MQSPLLTLALALFASLTLSTAAPATGCQPNFQGVAMAIFNGGGGNTQLPINLKWGLSPAPNNAGSPVLALPQDRVPDFRFESSGRPTGSYVVRAVNYEGQNLVVTNSGASTLDLSAENSSNTKEYFLLNCGTCRTNPWAPGPYATGCRIQLEDTPSVCVALPQAEGQALILEPCGGQQERFDFWTAA